MPNKTTIVYQLLVIALLVALIGVVFCKSKTCGSQKPVVAAAQPPAAAPAPAPIGEDAWNGWKRIKPSEIKENAIELIDVYKGLLTMGNRDEHNSMTIGWGSLGVLWSMPVYTVYVSSSRFSYTLMEKYDTFTVSFLNPSHMKDVMYLGTHSGRDGDKIGKTSLHLDYTPNGNPMFNDAFMVIECRKIYGGPYDPAKFGDVPKKIYERRAFGIHSEYVGEILNVYVKDENRSAK